MYFSQYIWLSQITYFILFYANWVMSDWVLDGGKSLGLGLWLGLGLGLSWVVDGGKSCYAAFN